MDEARRRELLELYKLAHAEYRAEVTLGWERQKLFLTLTPALMALGGGLGAQAPWAAEGALAAGAAVAAGGALIVWRSHGRFRATRARLEALADELAVTRFDTTGGMRAGAGQLRGERYRVITVIIALLVFYLLLALGLMWMLWPA
jgi:hypothetical protein